MWPKPKETADLVTFTGEILMRVEQRLNFQLVLVFIRRSKYRKMRFSNYSSFKEKWRKYFHIFIYCSVFLFIIYNRLKWSLDFRRDTKDLLLQQPEQQSWSTIAAAPIAARTFLKLCVLWMNFLSTKLEWVRFSEKFSLASGISTQISAQI